MPVMKVGHVSFEHRADFKGEALVKRGTAEVSVPIDALRALVAEALRQETIDMVMKAKPESFLKPESVVRRMA